ncbi:MAG: AIR synthase-related protein [Zavarzinella sp.]
MFCFAPPDYPPQDLPPGTLHPRRTMMGVVAGVRDYGNRMGIPTVNGAVLFDERYLANPLVYCGTVGVIPADRMHKAAQVGDYIVAVGGRTGRDGIHGATFSSLELTAESDSVSGGAVQIGNAITEKMVLDVILKARDLNLYHAITDCGAGGFSSAVGEMGADLGARVDLDQAPLKYSGLSYTEIWISESQERMVLAVPPKNWDALRYLCAEEGVEATVIGVFEDTKHLRLYYQQQLVGDIDMDFLHDGRPDVVRSATWKESQQVPFDETLPHSHIEILKKALADYSTCSKEWIIRQYDHEVQGGSVVKPLTGVKNDGPSDAAVVMPQLGNWKGLAVGNGINPWYGDLDPYWMAAAVIDEAIRNVVAVGADPSRIAILDNFCWGNTNDPVILGSLVRAAIACKEVALAYNTPFISGKDSLMNEYQSADRRISIPGTLLISSLGQVADVRKCVTMDAKAPGNLIYQIGETHDHLGASLLSRVLNKTGGLVPQVDLSLAPTLYQAVHRAISSGLIRSCHDLSEGGLAVALAEMAFAGGVGIDIDQLQAIEPNMSDVVLLYSETPSRFVVEVEPGQQQQFETVFTGLPYTLIGKTTKEARLRIADHRGEWLLWATLSELKENWQAPLRW